LQSIATIIESGQIDLTTVTLLIETIRSLAMSIDNLTSKPDSAFPATVDPNQFKNQFPAQLIKYLVAEYLLRMHPNWGEACQALGLIVVVEVVLAFDQIIPVEQSSDGAT
jgi:hypothetical protein